MNGLLNPSLLGMIGIPFLVAPFAYLFRRLASIASLLSVAAITFLLWWLWQLPDGMTTDLLGRQLAIYPVQRMALLILLLSTGGIFMLAWRISQGWSLFPFLLVTVGFLSGSLLFLSPEIAVLLAELGLLGCVFIVQSGRPGSTQAAMHLLTTVVLAIPLFLLAAFLLHRYDIQPDVRSLLRMSTAMLALGFGLVFALFPFHSWLPTVSETTPPTVTAFIVSSVPLVFFVLLVNWLARFPVLAEGATLSHLLMGWGMVAAVMGGVLAYAQDHLGRWWVHVALADLGHLLIGLGLGSSLSLQGTLYALVSRSLALLMVGQSLAVIHHRATSLSPAALKGIASRTPVSLLGMSLGSLALLGMPASSGFYGHWLIYRSLVANGRTPWVWVMLASTALAGIGYARIMRNVLDRERPDTIVEREPRMTSLFLLILILLMAVLTVFPQVVAGPVAAVVAMLPF